jgi:hypothetical protein
MSVNALAILESGGARRMNWPTRSDCIADDIFDALIFSITSLDSPTTNQSAQTTSRWKSNFDNGETIAWHKAGNNVPRAAEAAELGCIPASYKQLPANDAASDAILETVLPAPSVPNDISFAMDVSKGRMPFSTAGVSLFVVDVFARSKYGYMFQRSTAWYQVFHISRHTVVCAPTPARIEQLVAHHIRSVRQPFYHRG